MDTTGDVGGSKTRDSNAKAMLTAAWELLVESLMRPTNNLPTLFDHLGANDITAAANLSTGAFYGRWDTRDAFIEDMVGYALASERVTEYENVTSALEGLGPQMSLRQVVEVSTRVDLEVLERDPAMFVQANLWSQCQARPELQGPLRALYGSMIETWAPLYTAFCDLFGLKFRPPFTAEHFALLLTAIAEGLAMQRVVQPEIPIELFSWTVLALIPLVTSGTDDNRTLHDMWDQAERAQQSTVLARGGPLDPAMMFEVRSLIEVRAQRVTALRGALTALEEVDEQLTRALSVDAEEQKS